VQGGIDVEFACSSGDSGDILNWIQAVYQDPQGAELPETINPRVLENMFRQQSSPWENTAVPNIQTLIAGIQKFNEAGFSRTAPDGNFNHKL
jgi:hypothetical protein